ncbi:hypothetical protein C922_03166 [Plasmodium inui San Antonio 1]|uniref:Proteasome assembly chaperone 3 n=1 Tax=Plasmodium inui San Antonio 1 TaxID=1237626 RepID=W7A068_9APIC|nr:hypothetical protein C922_03166 [Plasmodium inui San Antonio 1]EUD66532.1 hypothetical protein C922_03166 [Plasmodium inui San Antonio 1]
MTNEQTSPCNKRNDEGLVSNGTTSHPNCFIAKDIEDNNRMMSSLSCHLVNHSMKKLNTHENNGMLSDKKNGQLSERKDPPSKAIPEVIKKTVNINHKDETVTYVYTLVCYKNYNIFFISPNGKFAVWIHSHNIIMPFSVEQETEIIFGERNYPYLEMFCTQFMKDHAALRKYKSIMFAICLHNMCFDDTKALTEIFVALSTMV